MFFRRSLLIVIVAVSSVRAEPLPDTKPLTRDGDLAAQMVEGIDKYLMRELAASVEKPSNTGNLITPRQQPTRNQCSPIANG